jgi:hypothetical protein
MQVMRNLFWTFYRATPESYRNAKSGESNHLWMINRLVQMGITRELSRLFRDQEWGTAQDRFFEGFVRASQAPGTARLLENLLAKDSKRTLFWAVIEQAFLETDRERAAGGRLAAWSFDALGALGPQSLDWSAGLIQQVNLILD